jgi:FkbM family methyltransferase
MSTGPAGIARRAFQRLARLRTTRNMLVRAALAPVALKRPAISFALSKIANSAPREGLVETNLGLSDNFRVRVPFSNSRLLFERPQDDVGERATLDLCRLLVPSGSDFLDVGANEGLFTFAIALAMGSDDAPRIHIFEPHEELFERLSQNLARNGIAARLNKSAVGRETGSTMFYRHPLDNTRGSLTTHYVEEDVTEKVQVEVVSLSDYLERHGIERAMLKIDVEGAGEAVWDGAKAALPRIRWFIMEIIGPEWDCRLPERIIRESGWFAYYIRDSQLWRHTGGLYPYLASCHNWLFCPLSPDQLGAALAGSSFTIYDATSMTEGA